MVRTVVTHPYVFSLIPSDTVATDTQQEYRASKTTNDIYHALLGCYLWKMLQVLLSDEVTKEAMDISTNNKDRKTQIERPLFLPSDRMKMLQDKLSREDSKDNMNTLAQRLHFFVLPFLRKCYILLHSCGLAKSNLELLWSCLSVNRDTLSAILAKDSSIFQVQLVRAECDAICQALFLPTLQVCLASNFGTSWDHVSLPLRSAAKPFDKVLQVVKCWTQTFFATLTEKHFLYIQSTNNIDSISPISLETCQKKCPSGPVPPGSAICLFCGTYLCLDCCDIDNVGLLHHSKHCGREKGVFLLVKTLSIFLVYEQDTIEFNSPYLDRHGENDNNMKRGNMMILNDSRMRELWKLVAEGGIPNKKTFYVSSYYNKKSLKISYQAALFTFHHLTTACFCRHICSMLKIKPRHSCSPYLCDY
ncbi:hypothetical protein RFI_21305 [Reticulomyxa filosa]|uniref:E3 ubiquitin-protein ligase n=1 Tax=Reticulomyxa filosa TaxID=46433 RepID=X6MSG8_RETFI|nr:hypothetical protein RFI_21305 [Reticulomyxa filosa]|eukprot:ETO16055.1 hypothetical protein RFI_21305 [Reticulomyxa filosa]